MEKANAVNSVPTAIAAAAATHDVADGVVCSSDQNDERTSTSNDVTLAVEPSSLSSATAQNDGSGDANGSSDTDSVRTPVPSAPLSGSSHSQPGGNPVPIPATPGILSSATSPPPLSVLFLSSDTGGGHRASALSLARQFELLYPGTTYQLLDVITEGIPSNASARTHSRSSSSSSFGQSLGGSSIGSNENAENENCSNSIDSADDKDEDCKERDASTFITIKRSATTIDGSEESNVTEITEKASTDSNQSEDQTQSFRTLKKSASSPPAFGIESFYKHLSAHPQQWKLLYHTTNTTPVRLLTDVGLKLATERTVTAKIKQINPDVVISVHPMMTAIPSLCCAKISAETGRHLPFFTVVTDLGSGHDAWFAGKRELERIFLASDAITELAVRRGRIPREKIVRSGLPIRHEFAVHARGMGSDRTSEEGVAYRMKIRATQLNLNDDPAHQVLLVMGGGEGCGALSSIVDSLYIELCSRCIDATVVVVCGRNAELKETLEKRDWDGLRKRGRKRAERRRKTVVLAQRVRKMLSSISSTGDLQRAAEEDRIASSSFAGATKCDSEEPNGEGDITCDSQNVDSSAKKPSALSDTAEMDAGATKKSNEASGARNDELKGSVSSPMSPCSSMESLSAGASSVQVCPLGFVTNMAEHMVGADLLISKAGPGTIAEAASLGLPVLLTSYLPGQEEGNVDFVIKNDFGAFVADSDPDGVAQRCSSWFRNPESLIKMSRKAMEAGVPNAAEDIARSIGQSVVRWMHHNEETAAASVQESDS